MIYFFLWIFEGMIVTLASVILDEFLNLGEDFPIDYLAIIFVFNILFIWRYLL